VKVPTAAARGMIAMASGCMKSYIVLNLRSPARRKISVAVAAAFARSRLTSRSGSCAAPRITAPGASKVMATMKTDRR
jgi:hypothetical protein